MQTSWRHHNRFAVMKIVAIYAFVGMLWIYLSDTVLAWITHDPVVMKYIAISKGLVFIIITASLLYILIHRQMNRLMKVNKALQERELLLQSTATNIPGAMCQFYVSDAGGYGVSYVSDRVKDIFGMSTDLDTFFESFTAHVIEEDRNRFLDSIREAVSTGAPWKFEGRFMKPDGARLWFQMTSTRQKVQDRLLFYGVLLDITEYKQAERLLRRREADLAEAQRIALLGSWSYDVRTQSVNWSEELYRVFDVEEGKFDGLYESFLNSVHPEDKAKVLETNRKAIKSGDPFEVEYRIRARNNQLKHIREVGYARKDNTGRISGLFGTAQDITDRKRDEEELQKFASILRRSSEVINLMTLDGKMIFLNETGCRMLGIDPDRVEEFNIRDVIPEPLGPMLKTELLPTLLMSGTWEGELQYKNIKTGDLVDVYAMTFTIADPVSKSPLYLANISRDISERKQAEAERIKLQEQLLQSQKLEAVGVLAGGVAHDFNNILGAIIGYAEITMDAMTPDDPLRQNLGKILDAAMRSTNIVRQLLAFARKQVIAPVLLDLNESVEATLKMIRSLIGENIELAWLPGTGPRKVLMDPSQLDQVLLNLCVNARDAIGGVGKVTIQTETVLFDETYCLSHTDVMAGKYVQLSVSDNGCGMDKETQKHIFDPFFTTKGPGKGTGMGLATVYGIVRQNSGFINAHSELGKGTTFKIYIPLHDVASPEVKKTAAFDLPRSRGETILVAEDDPTMLQMSKLMLQKLGYSVLSADKPSEALRLARDNSAEIHLFITDIVMPEMNGRDLAQQILAVRPKIKCLFMSGYTADVIAHQCVLEDGVHFIQKPFLLKELASKVREVLA